MKQIILLILSLTFIQTLRAQELTLTNTIMNENDFLNVYLKNHFHTKSISHNLIVADQKVKIALEPYMGSFFIDGGVVLGTTTNSTTPLQNIIVNEQPLRSDISVDYTNFTIKAGVDATIYPTGTYLRVQGGVQDYNISSFISTSVTSPPTSYRDKYLYPTFDITLVQPWLKNGFAYNMHSRNILIASNDTEIEYLEETIKLEETVLQALIQYHKLILQTKVVAIIEQSLSNLQSLLNTQNRLRRAGARAAFDIQQIQVRVNELEVELLQQKNNLELTFQILEERLAISLDRENLNFLDYSVLQDMEYNNIQIYEDALYNSKDLNKLSLLMQNIAHSVKITKNQILPELNTILSYQWAESLYQDHPTLGNKKVLQDNLYIGLQFKMPLVPFYTDKAKIRALYAKSNSLQYNQEHITNELNYLIKEKYNSWYNSSIKLDTQLKNLSLNKEIAIEALRRYRNSEMSIADFFDHEENYRQNQIHLAQDEFNKKISAMTIEVAKGSLLDTYGINITSKFE